MSSPPQAVKTATAISLSAASSAAPMKAPWCWRIRRTRELQHLSLFPAVEAGVAKRPTKRSVSFVRTARLSS